MKIALHQISAVFIAMLFVCSCSRSYNVQIFSYPPGSKPHENDWIYTCQVINWDPLGKKSTDRGRRKIQIIIKDKHKNKVLEDEFELEGASIESKIQWENIQSITLDLFERGNKYAEDDYNMQRVKDGPKHLVTLNYFWNGEKYIRSGTEKAH